MVLTKPIESNKYLQHFKSGVHVVHTPSPHVKESALGLI